MSRALHIVFAAPAYWPATAFGGPVPVNIYYSTDSGQTVKIAYSFGQNPKSSRLMMTIAVKWS